MSAALITLAVLASVAVYAAAGVALARRRMPAIWAAARKAWSFDDTIRGSVRQQVFFTVAFWPVVVPLMLLTSAARTRIDHLADQGDPVTLARKVEERDRHIAQLERELGIGRRP